MAQLMFDLGQRAYGKGMYGRSIEYLEGALTIIPRPTLFGGEVGSLIPSIFRILCFSVWFKNSCTFGISRYRYGLLWLTKLITVTKIVLIFTGS